MVAVRDVGVVPVAVVLVGVCALATGQSPEPVPQAPAVTDAERPHAASGTRNPEREALQADFVSARREFARVTAEALTSDELRNWVRGISQRVRLRRTEEDLWEVREAIDRLNRSGRVEAERAQRLAQREAELSREVERLRAPGAAAPGAGVAMPDQATVRSWVEREMAEETNHLADTLSDRELVRRTRRIHRLATLARFARTIQQDRRGPQNVGSEAPEVVPAGGVETTAGKIENADFSELGKPTTVPPELPEPSPEKGTTDQSPAKGVDSDSETPE